MAFGIQKKQPLRTLWKWISDTAKYAVKHFKELFTKGTED